MNQSGTYFAVLGASDGSMTAYDLNTNQFLDGGVKKWCISGEIGHARVNHHSMVIASSTGTIARFDISLASMFPQDNQHVQILRADGPVVALAMDDLNNEGIVGTSYGGLYYINFTERLNIRIVNKAYNVQRPITSVSFSEQNNQLVLTNCCNTTKDGSGLVKVWTAATLDQVMKFSAPATSEGPVAFVLSGKNGGKFSVIGH